MEPGSGAVNGAVQRGGEHWGEPKRSTLQSLSLFHKNMFTPVGAAAINGCKAKRIDDIRDYAEISQPVGFITVNGNGCTGFPLKS